MMKKSTIAAILGAFVLLIISYLGGTWYSSKQIPAYLEATIAEANLLLKDELPFNSTVKISQIDLEQGLFSSKVKYGVNISFDEYVYALDIPVDKASSDAFYFEFAGIIKHGPLPLLSSGNFAPNMAAVDLELVKTENSKAWFELTKDQTPLKLSQVIGYNQSSNSKIELTAFDYVENNLQIKFSGLNLGSKVKFINDNETKAVTNGKINSIEVLVENGAFLKLVISDISLSGDNLWQKNKEIITGLADFKIGNINAISPMINVNANFKDLISSADAKIDDNKLIYKTGISLAQVIVNKQDFGSGQFNLELANLDWSILQKIKNLQNLEQLKNPQNFDVTELANKNEQLKEQEGGLLVSLFAANPSVSFAPISWQTDKGTSNAAAKIVLQSSPSFDKSKVDISDLSTKLDLVKSVNLESKISIAMLEDLFKKFYVVGQMSEEAAASAAKNQVAELIAMQETLDLFEQKDGNLVTKITYADGVLTTNGKAENINLADENTEQED